MSDGTDPSGAASGAEGDSAAAATGDGARGPGESPSDLRRRLGVDHQHPPLTAAVVLGFALVHGWYAAWLLADLGLGTVAFVVVAAASAFWLSRQPTRRRAVVRGLYALAALLAATPLFMNLPFLLAAGHYGVGDPLAFTARLADAVFLLVFLGLAAVPAGVGWRLAGE